jgi:MOSC domain-containing protein YiiM
MDARIDAVYTAPEAAAPMVERDSVRAVADGLTGDRYCNGTGHYYPMDACEVTLIAAEALETAREVHGVDLSAGEHRRNLVTSGVDLRELLGATVRVGAARLRGTRPRPPCSHLEAVAGTDGVAAALSDGRGGICAEVLDAGTIAAGDGIEVLEPDPRTAGEAIADRLRRD